MKPEELNNPHNAFVKGMLERKESASDFFKQYLPQNIHNQLDYKTLEILKDSYVDKELSQHFTDILYRIKISGKPAYIYLLFEHKSYIDRLVGFQLLRYMVKIWENYLKQNRRAKRLPVILPFVLYHGKSKWSVSNRFRPLFEEIQFTEKYLPDYEFEIVDISHIPDDQIKGELLVRAFLLLLKYNKEAELFKALPGIFQLIYGLSDDVKSTEYIEMFLRYLMATVEEDKKNELKKEIVKSLKERGDIMPTIAEELIREGMEKGMEKGKIEDAEKMISKGMTNADIRDITGLSIKKIEEIRKAFNSKKS